MWMILVTSCVKYGPMQFEHEKLISALESTEIDKWTRKCAPKELARAYAHKEFAEIEFQQGDAHRAGDHLHTGLKNIESALKITDECRPKDVDGDGIMDDVDRCPDKPELINDYKDEDGCPEIDTDGDGIYDDADKCISDPEDLDRFLDEDGCPEYDNDNDGIEDIADKCPELPEDYDAYQDEDGCPEDTADTDGNGIMDDVDRCLTEAETKNQYLDEDGCPDRVPDKVRVTDTEIVIEDKILFQPGKAILKPVSYNILNSVAQVMRDYSTISVSIEGHTDSDGSRSMNSRLSKKRAEAVRRYLIKKAGIEASRLKTVGHGESKPIASNRTRSGKSKNRRVEFKIIDGMR